jgi:hypothetical protein
MSSLSKYLNVELGPLGIAFLVVLALAQLYQCVFFAYRRPKMTDIDTSMFAGMTFFISLLVFCSKVIEFTEGRSSLNELFEAVGLFLGLCMISFVYFCQAYIEWCKRERTNRQARERRQANKRDAEINDDIIE